MSELPSLLKKPEFPRSAKYDPDWMMDNQMGPNALWLMEWLCEALPLAPGMRVLDLGCGKAMTSIFLAREFGVHVYAADLWMSPDHNWRRAVEASVADLVCPIKAEAHALPFAQGFFDAVVSVDAYQYFGTDELYIDYLSRFVRPNGSLGVVVVGLMQEPGRARPPPTSPSRSRTARCSGKAPVAASRRRSSGAPSGRGSPMAANVAAATQPDGWRHWRDFERALSAAGKNIFPSDAEALDKDQGRYLGFVRLTAQRTDAVAEDLYDPALGAKVGVDK